MNCKRARLEIALWVGDDLDESAVVYLKQHIAECSGCHLHWRRMKSSLRRLQDPQDSSASRVRSSIWPDLVNRLPEAVGASRRADFNGWLPATAVLAACLAITAFWQNQPSVSSNGLTDQTPPRAPNIPRPPVATVLSIFDVEDREFSTPRPVVSAFSVFVAQPFFAESSSESHESRGNFRYRREVSPHLFPSWQ